VAPADAPAVVAGRNFARPAGADSPAATAPSTTHLGAGVLAAVLLLIVVRRLFRLRAQ
jgi:hypothetical protein